MKGKVGVTIAKRPTQVKIGPYIFDIYWDAVKLKQYMRADGTDRFGMSCMADLEIIIDPDRPLVGLQNTLVHELLHCLNWVYDIPLPFIEEENKAEEQYVSRMDTPMLLMVKENVRLFAWLGYVVEGEDSAGA